MANGSARAAVMAMLWACGASPDEVRDARQAVHTAKARVIIATVREVLATAFVIDEVASGGAHVATRPQRYNREGGRSAGGGEVLLAIAASIEAAGAGHRVVLSPTAQVRGAVETRMPGWVREMVDDLQVEIDQRLKVARGRGAPRRSSGA